MLCCKVAKLVYICTPMTFQSFEDMSVWQESRKLTQTIRVICKRSLVARDYCWTDQISRAALSIESNIAEGCGSQSNAIFVQFLGHSRRSAYEVRSQLYYGQDEQYMNKEEFDQLKQQTEKIAAQLSKLIFYLKNHTRNDRECFSQPIIEPNAQTPCLPAPA